MLVKPRRLTDGDTVAVLSLSWGGPHEHPGAFQAGLETLARLGLIVRECPTARLSPQELAADPRGRAQDLNEAFADPEVRGIFTSIGGGDSIRIVPYLDSDIIRENPKILLGYSDSTITNIFVHHAGVVSYHGPSVMAGLAQARHQPQIEEHVRSILFKPVQSYAYAPFNPWFEQYTWSGEDPSGVGAMRQNDGWHWVNGETPCSGALFGGGFEPLERLRTSELWPQESFWHQRMLFLETNAQDPPLERIRDGLRDYGRCGALSRVGGLILGRVRGYTDEQNAALDRVVASTVVEEFGARDLCVVTNMDFGHTDPQWILPLGVEAELDPAARTFRLLEPAVS